MMPQQYRSALARLGLTVASKATAEVLRTTVRSSQRYANGEAEVPPHLEDRLKLIEAIGVAEARRILETR
jgi:uncharacterized membrane protein